MMRFYMEQSILGDWRIRFGDTGSAYVNQWGRLRGIGCVLNDPTVDLKADADLLRGANKLVRKRFPQKRLCTRQSDVRREYMKRLIDVANIDYHIRSRDVA